MPDTITHPPLTEEEKARRLRMAELRGEIAAMAAIRRAVKVIYRMPHGSPEFIAAKHAFIKANKLKTYDYNPGWAALSPQRDFNRAKITEAHIELAKLRGKSHCPVKP